MIVYRIFDVRAFCRCFGMLWGRGFNIYRAYLDLGCSLCSDSMGLVGRNFWSYIAHRDHWSIKQSESGAKLPPAYPKRVAIIKVFLAVKIARAGERWRRALLIALFQCFSFSPD